MSASFLTQLRPWLLSTRDFACGLRAWRNQAILRSEPRWIVPALISVWHVSTRTAGCTLTRRAMSKCPEICCCCSRALFAGSSLTRRQLSCAKYSHNIQSREYFLDSLFRANHGKHNNQMSMDQKQQKDTFEIGIIGMGDMGRLYARSFYQSGWTRINVCDLPEKTASLRAEFPQYNVFENGHLVSRRSDLIIYSVEAKYIASVVAAFGPSTKLNAIVSGQTSVKAPEVAAFEQHLPDDVHIIPVHSMHGPNVSPVGQPLVMVQHRASDAAYAHAQSVYESLGSKVVHLTAKEHDRITADTQAATHLAFKSMGTAWMAQTSFPWEDLNYVGGVDNVKVAMTLRIYSAKWHVYAGLALLNPAARAQIAQYAKSVDGLFSLMIRERADEFRARVHRAVDFVFNGEKAVAERKRRGLLLADALLDEYTLSSGSAASAAAAVAAFTADDAASTKTLPGSPRSAKRNSHLSLLAMVDCWHALTTNPYEHLIVQTPPFRLWLGIVEYLCCTPGLLDAAIDAAIYEKDVRADDLAFVAATNGWAQTILQGHFDSYQARFEHTQAFFSERLEQGRQVSARIIETLGKNMRARGE